MATGGLFLATIAAAFDLRSREIPNWIPAAAIVWGLVAIGVGWSDHGLLSSFIGGLIGLVVLLPFYATGGLGAGDVKLMAGLGVIFGWRSTLFLLFAVALCGGIAAIVAKARGQADYAYGPAICGGTLLTTLLGIVVHGQW